MSENKYTFDEEVSAKILAILEMPYGAERLAAWESLIDSLPVGHQRSRLKELTFTERWSTLNTTASVFDLGEPPPELLEIQMADEEGLALDDDIAEEQVLWADYED